MQGQREAYERRKQYLKDLRWLAATGLVDDDGLGSNSTCGTCSPVGAAAWVLRWEEAGRPQGRAFCRSEDLREATPMAFWPARRQIEPWSGFGAGSGRRKVKASAVNRYMWARRSKSGDQHQLRHQWFFKRERGWGGEKISREEEKRRTNTYLGFPSFSPKPVQRRATRTRIHSPQRHENRPCDTASQIYRRPSLDWSLGGVSGSDLPINQMRSRLGSLKLF
jgi:hypothetical protein